jgi:hypothetical protein
MVSDIRQYFDFIITDCTPELERWQDDLFINNPINEAVADKYYKLFIGETVTERGGLEWGDTINVTLEIYKSLSRDKETDYDALYDRAIDIQRSLIDPNKIKANSNLNDIEPLQITPSEEDTNDDLVKMTMTFAVRQYYLY